jgi:hypothetical protein
MGGKVTSGSAVPPPRAPRPPRAPIPHSFLLQRQLEYHRSPFTLPRDWEFWQRLKTDIGFRTRVLDYLSVAGVVMVFGLAVYLLIYG